MQVRSHSRGGGARRSPSRCFVSGRLARTAAAASLAACAVELRDLFWLAPAARPRVAVSSCLLGEAVRWDGGHKRHAAVIAELGRFAEAVATCPEVAIGLGVPRPSLVVASGGEAGHGLRLVERDSRRDHTAALAAFAAARWREVAPLDGFVWKSRSPSCGPRGVAIEAGAGLPGGAAGGAGHGAGLFVRLARDAFPGLVELDEVDFAQEASVAAFRVACEWNLAWRSATASVRAPGGVARLHRKLRGWWRAVAPTAARALDRAVAAAATAEAGGRDPVACYAAVAAAELRRCVRSVVLARGALSRLPSGVAPASIRRL